MPALVPSMWNRSGDDIRRSGQPDRYCGYRLGTTPNGFSRRFTCQSKGRGEKQGGGFTIKKPSGPIEDLVFIQLRARPIAFKHLVCSLRESEIEFTDPTAADASLLSVIRYRPRLRQ